MRIFKLSLAWDTFDPLAFLEGTDRSYFDKISQTKLQSAIKRNRVFKMAYQSSIPDIERRPLPAGDFSFCLFLPVLSPHATEKLHLFLHSEGSLYPIIEVCGKRHTIFLPQTIKDALILGESKVEFFDSGEIMFIEKYAFDTRKLGDANVFMAPETEFQGMFCTEKFVEEISKNRLSGLEFKKIFSD